MSSDLENTVTHRSSPTPGSQNTQAQSQTQTQTQAQTQTQLSDTESEDESISYISAPPSHSHRPSNSAVRPTTKPDELSDTESDDAPPLHRHHSPPQDTSDTESETEAPAIGDPEDARDAEETEPPKPLNLKARADQVACGPFVLAEAAPSGRVKSEGKGRYWEEGKRIRVPASINTFLRPYQRDGVRFFFDRWAEGRGGILGDDMGL